MRAIFFYTFSLAVLTGLNFVFAESAFSIDLTLLSRQANQAMREGDYKRAIALTSQVIDLSHDASCYVMRSGAYFELHDYKNSLADATRAIEVNPKFRTAYERRALVRFASGDKKGAISDAIQNASMDPQNPMVVVLVANMMFQTKDYKSAKLYYDKALTLYEKGLGGPVQRTVAPGVKNQAHVTEISSGLWVAPAYSTRARCHESLGQYKEAVADLDQALKIQSENVEYFLQRAHCKIEAGDKKGACADYDTAIKIDSDNPDAYHFRGKLRASLRDISGANKDFAMEKSLRMTNPE